MCIDSVTLAAFASAYTEGMTSIRGRRVQRLLRREFSGAEHVLLAQLGAGGAAVLGLSFSGAALCATDGKGKHASIVKWTHGSAMAVETRFDLHKDSFPVLSTTPLSIATLRQQIRLRVPSDAIPSGARPLVSRVLDALA